MDNLPHEGRNVKPAHGRARLTLRINDTDYRMVPITCEGACLRCFELRKVGTKDHYHVSQHAHGLECSCPDFIFHRDGKDERGCKHIRALITLGILVEPVAPAPPPDDFPRPTGRPSPRNRVPADLPAPPPGDDFLPRGKAAGHDDGWY